MRPRFYLGLSLALLSPVLTASHAEAALCPRILKPTWKKAKVTAVSVAAAALGYYSFETVETEPNWVELPAAPGRPEAARRPELRAALLGDSLSMSFSLGSAAETLWQMRTSHQGGWFLAHPPQGRLPQSLLERMAANSPVYGVNYSSVASLVDAPEFPRSKCLEEICNIHSLSQQVDQWLQQKTRPDLTLLWIGSDNADWTYFPLTHQPPGPARDAAMDEAAQGFARAYRAQLERILQALAQDGRRHAVVVYGLVNFRSFFEARDANFQKMRSHPELFPHAQDADRAFISMQSPNREGMLAMADRLNQSLETVVNDLQSGLSPELRLIFSRTMEDADLSNPDYLNPRDDWHPSTLGADHLAADAFRDLQPTLRFLQGP